MRKVGENRKRVQRGIGDDEFEESLCVQTFEAECNINNIMANAANGQVTSHINRNQAYYDDFALLERDWYEDSMNKIADMHSLFADLPSEVRAKEFHNDIGEFSNFLVDKSTDEILEVLPQLAEKGLQYPNVLGGGATEAPLAPSPQPKAGKGAEAPSSSGTHEEGQPAPSTPVT